MKRGMLLILAVLIYVIASIHLLAHWLFLYWMLPWLDSVMHMLSGLWIGLFILWLLYHSPYRRWMTRIVAHGERHGNAMVVLGGAFIFGTLWELYQLAGHLIFNVPFKSDYLRDSVSDVLFGILGAGIGLMLYRVFLDKRDGADGLVSGQTDVA